MKKITKKQFLNVFNQGEPTWSWMHLNLCSVFKILGYQKEWNRYWNKINTYNFGLMSSYISWNTNNYSEEEYTLRLMIAIEFMRKYDLLEE